MSKEHNSFRAPNGPIFSCQSSPGLLSYPEGVLTGSLNSGECSFRGKAGRSVSVRIRPLQLEGFEQLPKHARCCVFWEVDPETLNGADHLPDPEFEKEAWLSMVMLEWGSCGQVAVAAPGAGIDEGRGGGDEAEDSGLG